MLGTTMPLGTTTPGTSLNAPTPPLLSYAGLGLALQRTQKRVAAGVFDRQATPTPSLLQQAVKGFTAPKTLLGA